MQVIVHVIKHNSMSELEKKINTIIKENLYSVGIISEDLSDKLSSQIINEFRRENKKNFENLLEFCKLVEKEEKGLLFIMNMINNIID